MGRGSFIKAGLQKLRDLLAKKPDKPANPKKCTSCKRPLKIDDKQVQKKFKHAEDFGIDGPYSKSNAQAFKSALEKHMQSPDTQTIAGHYRGDAALFNVKPSTGVTVIQKTTGEFVSGWKLSPEQLQHVMTNGRLN
jgi:hypothetical protein